MGVGNKIEECVRCEGFSCVLDVSVGHGVVCVCAGCGCVGCVCV